MSYNIIPTPLFKSQAKRLIKKFPSLKYEEVYLLTIYDKSEIAPIDDKTIKFLVRQITNK